MPAIDRPLSDCRYNMPGIDSINLWGYISGVEKTSPRTEVPICIDMPLFNGTSALIVGDYKMLLGPQNLAFWQGPSFPNATGCPAGTPDNKCFDMYAGSNFHETVRKRGIVYQNHTKRGIVYYI